MPVSRNAHQAQLFATPPVRTKFVTRFGVSVLKVVATIDAPTSHQGAARPEVKNSVVLRPARRASRIVGVNEMTIETRTIAQSSEVGLIQPARLRASPPRTAREARHGRSPCGV